MDTNLLLKEEVYEIVSCALEVHREIGPGLIEKPYERALAREFSLREISFDQQKRFPVFYKGWEVGEFIPDLIVYGQIVVDTKVISAITDLELGQMLNYLKITQLKVGVILNFKHTRLEWKRLVL